MNNPIYNFILARRICKRYRIKFNPFVKLDTGSLQIDNADKITVSVNVFNSNFIPIFWHEIGHYIHHTLVNYKIYLDYYTPICPTHGYLLYNKTQDFYKCLYSEMFASRFALKVCGAKHKKYLIKCFHTYTSAAFKTNIASQYKFTRFVDFVEKLSRKLDRY
ncbi:hypothetical protein RVBP16_0990 [Pseudomonas phage sp. 30-2]|nr:hypothetical protein RVBP16_0990 [Pseudomonas phage sp. 30-2]